MENRHFGISDGLRRDIVITFDNSTACVLLGSQIFNWAVSVPQPIMYIMGWGTLTAQLHKDKENLSEQTISQLDLKHGLVSQRGSHYSDVIMSAMTSQITGLSIVCLTVCPGTDQRKKTELRVTGLCEGNPPVTGGFPSQRASNAENVSIWWRHHE